MRRTNWERFVPAELRDAEKAADPQAYFWLCQVCGERLRYTEHPAYPIHCEQRSRVLHHAELDGHYVVSAGETQRRLRTAATEVERKAYVEYRYWRKRLRQLLTDQPYRPAWSPHNRDLPPAQKRRITIHHRQEHQRAVAEAWTYLEHAAAESAKAANRLDDI